MNFITTKNPAAALSLIPWLVPNGQSIEEIYLELRERLEEDPEETYVCMIVDGNFIKGMAIAYCRYNDVFIWQARKAGDLSSKFVNIALENIKEWARNKGYDSISAVPIKPAKVFSRRFGFQKSINNEISIRI